MLEAMLAFFVSLWPSPPQASPVPTTVQATDDVTMRSLSEDLVITFHGD